MPIFLVQDPTTGEEVELEAPEGMSQREAMMKAFPNAGVQSPYGGPLASGLEKGLLGMMKFPWQAGVGLISAGTGAADKYLGTNLQEPFEHFAYTFQKPVENLPGVRASEALAEQRFPEAWQRYAKEGMAGLVGGAIGPGNAMRAGATTGALGGLLGQAAQEADLSPIAQLAATVFPALGYAGYRALRDPPAIQQMKSALAATSEGDLAQAAKLIAKAKARGVELSPAQALGPNHPLVPILEQVGRSAGGSDQVKIFLGAQDVPTNTLTNQVTNAFGQTDAQTAANTVAKRAAGIRAAQEKAPGRLAAPYYAKAEVEPLPPGVVDDLTQQLKALRDRFGANTASARYIEGKLKALSDGKKTVEQARAILDDEGLLKLVRETQDVDIPIDTYGKLKNVRDEARVDLDAVPMAGEGASGSVPLNVRRDASQLIREASKTSPNLSAADALFAKRMRDLEKVRMGPLTQLAGPQLRDADAASNFTRISQFLDPARNSPRRIDKTLSQLTEPKEKVVQQLTSGYLRNATERARRSEGFAPAQIETLLRGGEGSGKRTVLESLIRRSIGEQNRANPLDPLDAQQFVDNLMANLDVMEAAGRGRGALSGVENIPRVAAQLDTPVQLARGSSANVVSQTPSLIRMSEQRANRQLAEALTDPSMQKMLEMRDYDRLALISEILRRATQTAAVTGD